MEQLIFISASGERFPIVCTVNGDMIAVDNGNPFTEYSGGKFERVLPDQTTEMFYVRTYRMLNSGDGFGCSFQMACIRQKPKPSLQSSS